MIDPDRVGIGVVKQRRLSQPTGVDEFAFEAFSDIQRDRPVLPRFLVGWQRGSYTRNASFRIGNRAVFLGPSRGG